MENKKSMDYKIGFSDSEILSYHSKENNLIIFLKCWNEKILQFEFVECVLFLILNSWNISDICETTNSSLMEKALIKVYEEVPPKHDYKLFQFIDNDADPVVEVVCKNMIISDVDCINQFLTNTST